MLLTYWLTSWTARLGLKSLSAVRRRQPQISIAPRAEQCEARYMLSAVTAFDDHQVVPGKNVAIIFDVLVNDSSTANGDLQITSLTQSFLTQPSHGTVWIIPADPNATGAAARDRIAYLGDGVHVGADAFEYEAIDVNGATDVALVTINMLSLPVAEIGTDGEGRQTVTGGLGGTGYLADPSTGFTPTSYGNFEYQVSQTGGWAYGIGLGDDPDATGIGEQTITQTVTTTDDGYGNWSYTEIVDWTYGLTAGEDGDDENSIEGSSRSILEVVSTGGITTTSYSFTSTDDNDTSKTTIFTDSGSDALYTDESWSSYSFSLTIVSTEYADGSKSGSQSSTSSQSSGFVRTGTYSYALSGGNVDGTYLTSVGDSQTSSYSIVWAEDPIYGWTGIGTSSDSGFGDTSSSYSGSGGYGSPTFVGAVIEGGSQSSHYGYATTGIYNSTLGWLTSGTGSANGSQSDARSYDGTGTYSSDEDGVSKSGTTIANGHNNSESDYSVTYVLTSGVWDVVTSTGSGSGDSDDYTSYSGTGTYTRSLPGGTIDGTLTEDGHTHSYDSFTTTQAIGISGAWLTSGSGNGGTDGHNHSEFEGSGSYSSSGSSQSGSVSQSMSGTASESGNNSTTYSSSANWSLGEDGWELSSGTGTESGSEHVESESSGTGSYSRNVPLSSGGYQASVSGSRNEESTYNNDNDWSASNEVVGGEWVRVSGSGAGSITQTMSSEYSGSGTYSAVGPYSAAISGTITESGGDSQNTESSTTSNWTGAAWETSGSSVSTGANHAVSAYAGSGSYGWTDQPASGGGTSSMNGTATQSGDSETTGGFTLNSNLDSSGSWTPSDGTSSGSGKSNALASYSGSGTYSKGGTDEEFGVWSITGTNSGNGQQSQKSDYSTESIFENGEWVLASGTSSASGTATATDTSSGSGSYSYQDDEVTVANDITQSGSRTEQSQWGTEGSVVSGSGSGGAWVTTGSGSGTTSGTDSLNFTTASGSFSMEVEGGVITGDFTDYFLRTSNDNSQYGVTLNATGEWVLSSGSGSGTYSEGYGTNASGSGALTWGGDDTNEDDVVIGSYFFNGTGTYTQKETNSVGTFGKYEVQDGEWVTTDSGSSASGDSTESYAWSGTGIDERLGITGTYTQSGGNGTKSHTEVSQGSSGSASGSGYSQASSNYMMQHSGSGEVTIQGTTGLLETKESENNNWSAQINLEWQADDFVATSGSGTNTSTNSNSMNFSGAASESSSGMSWSSSYNYDEANEQTETQGWTYQPGTDTWIQSSGSGSGSGHVNENSAQSTSQDYVTDEFGVAGTKSDSSWDESALTWTSATQFISGSGGGWSSSGSGSGTGSVGSQSAYSASGSISVGPASGTYEESGDDLESFDYELTLEMTNDVWTQTGTGSGSGNGSTHMAIHLDDSNWSVSAYGGTVTGTQTEEQTESSHYDFEYDATLLSDPSEWSITSGSGSGGGSANYSRDASGSGTYTASFGSSSGTLNGTNSVSQRDAWDYEYTQEYTIEDGAWITTEEGSGTTEESSLSEYAGSGSYAYSTVLSSMAYSNYFGDLEEHGHTSESVNSTFTWTDADWTMTTQENTDNLSHSEASQGVTFRLEQPPIESSPGAWTTNDYTSYDTTDSVSHSESSSSGTSTETHFGNDATWSKSSSGGSYSYTEQTHSSGYHNVPGVHYPDGSEIHGDYTGQDIQFSRAETNSTWEKSSADDGSSLESGTDGGNNQWSNSTLSGETGIAVPTVTSGSSSWSTPWSNSTPPNSPNNFGSPQAFLGEWSVGEGGQMNLMGGEGDSGGGTSLSDYWSIITVSDDRPKGLRTQLAENLANEGFTQPASSPQSQELDQLLGQAQQNQDAAAGILADPDFLDFGDGITEEQLLNTVQAVGLIGASLVPGVGEALDVATLADPNATLFERNMAYLSLNVSAYSYGLVPNFGAVRGLFKSGSKTAGGVGQQVARHGDDMHDAVRQSQGWCFPAGTPIATNQGKRPIETIVPGHQVWAFDLGDGKWKLKTVLKNFIRDYDFDSIFVTVYEDTIESTQLHPYWVVAGEMLDARPRLEHLPDVPPGAKLPGRWVDAQDLRIGDILWLRDGRQVPITALSRRPVSQKVYNFSVEDLQCYAVGELQVLVHNSNGTEARLPVTSRIKESPKLVKGAASAGQSNQTSINALVEQLSRGNLNPGIGTKPIGSGLSEARARDGARVYFRQLHDGTIEILGKSTKSNQSEIIAEVLKLFGK